MIFHPHCSGYFNRLQAIPYLPTRIQVEALRDKYMHLRLQNVVIMSNSTWITSPLMPYLPKLICLLEDTILLHFQYVCLNFTIFTPY